MKEGFIASVSHCRLDCPIDVYCYAPVVITVENPVEMYRLVSELKRQCDGGDGDFVFTFPDKRYSVKSCAVITDFTALDVNDKKNISALHRELAAVSTDGELQIKFNELVTSIAQYLHELTGRIEPDIEFDEPDIGGLLKLNNVRIQYDYESLIEKTVCFINTEVALRQRRLFVFVHLKSYLSDFELAELYKHCETEKIGLILLEGRGERNKLKGERSVIITEDLCDVIDFDDSI